MNARDNDNPSITAAPHRPAQSFNSNGNGDRVESTGQCDPEQPHLARQSVLVCSVLGCLARDAARRCTGSPTAPVTVKNPIATLIIAYRSSPIAHPSLQQCSERLLQAAHREMSPPDRTARARDVRMECSRVAGMHQICRSRRVLNVGLFRFMPHCR